jgi:protease I
MNKPLSGIKIAILVANGFTQQDFTEAQKVLNAAGATLKIISPDQGLVNGWEGTGWGHHFPVDQQLSTALGADFDMLVMPGGQRSLDKLKTTAHTRRFVGSFLTYGKPVALFGDAVGVLIQADHAAGRRVAGADSSRDMLVHAGATWADEAVVLDNMLYSGRADNAADRAAFAAGMVEFFISSPVEMQQAA